jgi:hypothetical protein
MPRGRLRNSNVLRTLAASEKCALIPEARKDRFDNPEMAKLGSGRWRKSLNLELSTGEEASRKGTHRKSPERTKPAQFDGGARQGGTAVSARG